MAVHAGGREHPGRLFFALARVLEAPGLQVLALAGLVAATRLPLRTRYLLNWDADQFALGMQHFDVLHHQPHPPGYPGYIALGRALLTLFPDPNAALQALSIAGEAAGAGLAFAFAGRLFGQAAAWVTALAMLVSPLFWYYGEAANVYALEPLLALAVAWFAWAAWNGERRAALPLALALAGAGAIRPSTAVLLAPLGLLALIRLGDPRRLALAAAVAVAGTLAWLAPLVAISGGPGSYLAASTALGSDVTTSTAIWEAGLGGLATTAEAVLRGTIWELGGFAVVLLFGLAVAPRLLREPLVPPGWLPFCAAWAAPALLTFLFVHIGQVAYVQIFTPALFLAAGPALSATARALGSERAAPALAALCAAAGVLIFTLPPGTSLAGQLRRHDAWVEEMTGTVRQFDPSRTVVVANAYAAGSYRTAQVYLPEYHRVGIGRDRTGSAGEIFGDLYTPEGFDRAQPVTVPAGTDTYVFVDRSAVESLVADPERLRTLRFPDGSRIYVWTGARPVAHDGLIWLGPVPTQRRGLDP